MLQVFHPPLPEPSQEAWAADVLWVQPGAGGLQEGGAWTRLDCLYLGSPGADVGGLAAGPRHEHRGGRHLGQAGGEDGAPRPQHLQGTWYLVESTV